jgi:hypothetical protein
MAEALLAAILAVALYENRREFAKSVRLTFRRLRRNRW